MRKHTMFAAGAFFCAISMPALAQMADTDMGARPGNEIGTGNSLPRSNKASNIGRTDTHSRIAPNLPNPLLGEDAASRDYVAAARQALKSGQTGKAQQSLEMAETRLLDRSTVLFQTHDPSQNPLVQQLSDARHALGNGDRAQALAIIDGILAR